MEENRYKLSYLKGVLGTFREILQPFLDSLRMSYGMVCGKNPLVVYAENL